MDVFLIGCGFGWKLANIGGSEYNNDEQRYISFCKKYDSTNVVLPFAAGKKSIALQKVRDIIKSCIIKKNNDMFFVLLGIENQSDIHYAMPVRQMLYNAMSYTMQVDSIAKEHWNNDDLLGSQKYLSGFSKEDKILPVITVTLYWGDQPWDAPTNLFDMLIPHHKGLDRYLDKSDINLFSIIDGNGYEKCGEELKTIFEPLHYRNDKAKFDQVLSNRKYANITKEQMELLIEFTDLKRPPRSKKGGYDMCNAVKELKIESKMEGINIGLTALVHSLKKYIPDPVGLWKAVIENKGYENVTFEQVKKLL